MVRSSGRQLMGHCYDSTSCYGSIIWSTTDGSLLWFDQLLWFDHLVDNWWDTAMIRPLFGCRPNYRRSSGFRWKDMAPVSKFFLESAKTSFPWFHDIFMYLTSAEGATTFSRTALSTTTFSIRLFSVMLSNVVEILPLECRSGKCYSTAYHSDECQYSECHSA